MGERTRRRSGEGHARWIDFRLPMGLLTIVLMAWLMWPVFGARWIHGLVQPPSAANSVNPGASAPTACVPTESSAELSALGQVGDLFGGLNALFAAFAFVGVLWAGILQRQALLDAKDAYDTERRAIARQQFEGTFFHLLTLLREVGQESQALPAVAESLADADLSKQPDTFRHLAEVLFASIRTARPSTPEGELLRELVERYEGEINPAHSSSLGRYFRALHQTLDLIDSQSADCLSATDKVRYANIVRGQIPESLLFLLSVNGLRRPGRKTRHLIARYGLLKYLRDDHKQRLGDALKRVYGDPAFAGHATRQAIAPAQKTADEEWWLQSLPEKP